MRKNLHDVIRVSEKTVIPLGKLGCFDEHGIFPMNVMRHGDAVYGYTCGWNRRISVSVDTAIGLAISRDDGLTFQRIGDGPVMAASLHEPCLVGDCFVKVIGDVFHMCISLVSVGSGSRQKHRRIEFIRSVTRSLLMVFTGSKRKRDRLSLIAWGG